MGGTNYSGGWNVDDCEKEKKLLRDLDTMVWDSWLSMVRWAAPTLARDNPKLLAEIIIRRGMKRAAELKLPEDYGRIVRSTCQHYGRRN
jgi:hypothetical protein